MKVAAIVVTHNSERHVADCLRPLLHADAEAWVVDNASADSTVRLVRERFPEVHLLANSENRGFACAVNQALGRADADVVLLVNPDCVTPTATARALVEYLAAHPDAGLVAPRLRDACGRVAVSAHPFENAGTVIASRFGGRLLPLALRRMLGGGERRRNDHACREGCAPVSVDWVSGACLAVRGDLLRRIGGLDAGYFLYYEDEELCFQALRSGARVVYLPTVEAMHLGGGSSSDPVHLWPHLYRSLLRFQARHRPGTYQLVRAAVFVRALLGTILGISRALVSRDRRGGLRRASAWGRVARITLLQSEEIKRSAA